jgi:phenylacetate-CoA ligase
LSPSELKKTQIKKLRQVLKHAYENIAFYHKRFKSIKVKPNDIKSIEDLHKIPVLTKSEVQKNFKSLIARGISMSQCKKEQTSGSTGVPLTVITEKRAAYLLKANELRHYIENGGSLIKDKFVLLGSRNLPDKRTLLGSFLKRLGIFRTTRMCILDPIEDVFDNLVNFKPDVIKAYPSYLLLLAREIEKRGPLIHPKFIWSNGELLDAKSRKRINSAFEIDMFDGYGCTEAGYVAWECTEHIGYHINIDMVVTEFVRDGEQVTAGERGEIVLTPLWNNAMPLIRYRIDDVGIASDERCPCGRGLPLMKIIEGRSEDFIVLPSGRVISPLITLDFFENIEGIAEYKIIQERKDFFIIQIVLKEECKNNMLSQLRKRFKEGLGEDVKIEIEIVNTTTPSGKVRRVVSKCLPREKFI